MGNAPGTFWVSRSPTSTYLLCFVQNRGYGEARGSLMELCDQGSSRRAEFARDYASVPPVRRHR